jgi:hypothetical protein
MAASVLPKRRLKSIASKHVTAQLTKVDMVPTTINGELRIRDVDLGARPGFDRQPRSGN